MANKQEIENLLAETSRDLEAFSRAQGCIEQRIVERRQAGTVEDFSDWAGTKAAVNVLIMVRVRCEGLMDDLENHLLALEEKER
jgi:hypothetical protein